MSGYAATVARTRQGSRGPNRTIQRLQTRIQQLEKQVKTLSAAAAPAVAAVASSTR